MSSGYKFKRNFYYAVEKSTQESSVTFLLGARKTGKTVCMKQLASQLEGAEYYDVKAMGEDDHVDLIDKITDSIRANEKRIFLIDETTYLLLPEKMIAKIANAYTDCKNTNTKVVFTGSQSVALEAWASRSFAGNAMFIYADFLSYPEWLAFQGINEVSEKTYNDYILGTREFYGDFVSLDTYLKGCLEETVQSNHKTSNIILNNNCDSLDVQTLKNILYSALIAQADRPSLQNFFDKDCLLRKIRFFLKDAYQAAGSDTVRQKIDDIFSQRITGYSSTDFETLKQGFVFLQKCGLVTLTYVSDETHNFENIIDVGKDLCRLDKNKIKNKNDLFSRVNICIKYPMFYAEIIKEVLGDQFPFAIKGDILGGIAECQVRGLLPQDFCYEYHADANKTSGTERETYYVNYAQRFAVAFDIRNQSASELHFDDLPKDFEKILLTRDQCFTDQNGIVHIPYYQFIYDNSAGGERSDFTIL